MKVRMFWLFLGVGVLLVTLGGCGCFMQAQKGEAPPPPPPEQQKVVVPEQKPEVVVTPTPPPAPVSLTPGAVAVVQDINFDFDRYAIRSADAEILKKNLNWFKTNPGQKMRIEGNCDERGTVEYNLALGQKRADAAKNYLINLGVDGGLLETISYGKERPVDPGHDEAAWAKNRRDHFVPVQ
jgi:peptidoglycan-associated lipoprotein